MARAIAFMTVLAVLTGGCARMVVRKDPGPRDHGIRYYRPKPYLFIGPGPAQQGGQSDGQGGQGGGQGGQGVRQGNALDDGTPAPPAIPLTGGDDQKSNVLPILMRIEYLPDYSEEYSIRMKPGLGTTKLTVNLQNGWNLVSVNTETDQQYAAIISSLAQLAGAAGGLVGGKKSATASERAYGGIPGLAECDVPLGYYEAVLAINECGKRELMGWRYVGFFPSIGCPVKAKVHRDAVYCEQEQMYAVVFEDNVLKMKKMDQLCEHCQTGGSQAPPSQRQTEQPETADESLPLPGERIPFLHRKNGAIH